MTTKPERERRHAPRALSRLAIVLTDDRQEVSTTTENISASGAYCRVSHYLPVMTKVRIRLELSAQSKPRTVRCQGVIVRIEPPLADPSRDHYDVAIFFHELDDRDRSVLSQYVQQHLQRAPST